MTEPERLEAPIAVTPEMVEAGYRVLEAAHITDDLLEAERLTVAEIYRAMYSMRPLSTSYAPSNTLSHPKENGGTECRGEKETGSGP